MADRTDDALTPAVLDAVRRGVAALGRGSADSMVEEVWNATQPPLMAVDPGPSASRARRHLPAVTDAAMNGPAAALLDPLRPALPRLDWHYGYASRPDLADDVAFANIVGPRGPFVCPTVRIGLTLIGPNVTYPAHSHPAAELYVVLAGEAEWSAGKAAARRRPPGAAILHPPDVVHAMRTLDSPLLALFVWTGRIDAPAQYAP